LGRVAVGLLAPVGAKEGGLLGAVVCMAVNKAMQSPSTAVAIRDTLELGPARLGEAMCSP